MDIYDEMSFAASRLMTNTYSTSFGMATRLIDKRLRAHVYNVYGLVRLADEVVDTYRGPDAQQLLDDLEQQTYAALQRGYCTNPIVHAFAVTARLYGIDSSLLTPFFASMRMDLSPQSYTQDTYQAYIHGSAEVIGLMCLRVFCEGNDTQYRTLQPGAQALGSAFQKVNFLRDLAADSQELQRTYFPGVRLADFTEDDKLRIIADIRQDFADAEPSVNALPVSARPAVATASAYYQALLSRIANTPVDTLKTRRIRLPNLKKWIILARTSAASYRRSKDT